MTFEEVIKDLEAKKAEIMKLDAEMKQLKSDHEAKINEFVAPLQAEMTTLDSQIQEKIAQYKMAMKTAFGVTEGEKSDLLEMFKAIRKVSQMDKSGLILP